MKRSYDVVVVGSGAAGLTAALTASVSGASVLIVEKTALLGGTSAMSGGGLWVPANHIAQAAGLRDSPEEALAYIRAACPAELRPSCDEHWQRFAEEAPRMLAFVEQHTPVRFALTPESDPYPECDGAKSLGRMLSPLPLRRAAAGRMARLIRPSTMPHLFTYQEMIAQDVFHHPLRAVARLAPTLAWRALTGRSAKGNALVAGLLRGCEDAGCEFAVGALAVALLPDADARVTGIRLDIGGAGHDLDVRTGVVLASGGFEWNSDLRVAHFPGPVDYIGSPCGNTGDGHRMAAGLGAHLEHMREANIVAALPTRYEGRLSALPVKFHLESNVMLVDGSGRRFASEYDFNLGAMLDRRAHPQEAPVHQPAWLVSDKDLLRRSPMIGWYARNDPTWLRKASTIEELARKIGVPAPNLQETLDRYNGFCASGIDHDFHRGESSYEASVAKKVGKLEPIRTPPFLAIRLNRSILGTKGGVRTSPRGEALRSDGTIIEGLYCAGAVAAGFIGTYAISSGTTLGPYMTGGYICGQELAERHRAGPSASGGRSP